MQVPSSPFTLHFPLIVQFIAYARQHCSLFTVHSNFLHTQSHRQHPRQRVHSHELFHVQFVFSGQFEFKIIDEGKLMIINIAEPTAALGFPGLLIKQEGRDQFFLKFRTH